MERRNKQETIERTFEFGVDDHSYSESISCPILSEAPGDHEHEEASQTKTVKEVSHDRFAEQPQLTEAIRSETPPSRQHAHGGIRDQLHNNHIQQST